MCSCRIHYKQQRKVISMVDLENAKHEFCLIMILNILVFYLEYDVFKLFDESARLRRSRNADWDALVESTDNFLDVDVLEADI